MEKMLGIMNNMLDIICKKEKNDFAIFDGEGKRCLNSNQLRLKTCSKKSVHSVAKRIIEKFIENEHFTFEMDTDDCK